MECVKLACFVQYVKVSPLQVMKALSITGHEGPLGDVDTSAHLYIATALERGTVASPTLGRLYSRYSFFSRPSGSQGMSAHEGGKKISTHPAPGTSSS